MSMTAFLEIVDTGNGEVILRRADSSEGSSEPLVAIRFSAEVRALLADNIGTVARAMIGTGVKVVGQMQAQNAVEGEGAIHQLH
jgi:hypothetical protein